MRTTPTVTGWGHGCLSGCIVMRRLPCRANKKSLGHLMTPFATLTICDVKLAVSSHGPLLGEEVCLSVRHAGSLFVHAGFTGSGLCGFVEWLLLMLGWLLRWLLVTMNRHLKEHPEHREGEHTGHEKHFLCHQHRGLPMQAYMKSSRQAERC